MENVEVVPFRNELAHYFSKLNREWIERYFVVEKADLVVFENPFATIVEPGGQIFFVISAGKALGTCAVIRHDSEIYELAKMAVSPEAQGRGYGNLLAAAAIEFARSAGAKTLMLLSNSRLGPALRLYEKHGFHHVPVSPDHEYSRVDVQMELCLNTSAAESPIFGSPTPNIQYTDRRAAYAVILNNDGKVATVKGHQGHFLPGGGSLPDEVPEDTIIREVCEELAQRVHLTRRIGKATQYFYSSAEDRHYKMLATFFAGELTNEPCDARAEHELYWLVVEDLELACFHACHVWAVKVHTMR